MLGGKTSALLGDESGAGVNSCMGVEFSIYRSDNRTSFDLGKGRWSGTEKFLVTPINPKALREHIFSVGHDWDWLPDLTSRTRFAYSVWLTDRIVEFMEGATMVHFAADIHVGDEFDSFTEAGSRYTGEMDVRDYCLEKYGAGFLDAYDVLSD